VWIVGHGWHVGLALRVADVRAEIWREAHDGGAADHVEVGWGDGTFYPAAHGTLAMALRAAFRSRSSVLHVAAFQGPVEDFFAASPIVLLRLSPSGFDDLCRFVAAQYARDADGRPIGVAGPLYGAGGFFLARGRYRALDNSNQWVARALRAGGVPVVPALSLFAGTVLAEGARYGMLLRDGAAHAGAAAGGRRARTVPGAAEPW
jgi:uncharacterized protein (TIGR02117 family)